MNKFRVYAKIVSGKLYIGTFEADSSARAVWLALRSIHSEEFVMPASVSLEDEEISTQALFAFPEHVIVE